VYAEKKAADLNGKLGAVCWEFSECSFQLAFLLESA